MAVIAFVGLVGSFGLFLSSVRDGRTSTGLTQEQLRILHNEVVRARANQLNERVIEQGNGKDS
ncbi:hypothetical protein QPK87_13785 [Kamptonema cortianum]|nr:hypothetical protein [Geitlerinema splendidum]MDK3157639.1 hypothetical protein [Kamptonema cortianum]